MKTGEGRKLVKPDALAAYRLGQAHMVELENGERRIRASSQEVWEHVLGEPVLDLYERGSLAKLHGYYERGMMGKK